MNNIDNINDNKVYKNVDANEIQNERVKQELYIPPDFSKIPIELKKLDNWVCWKYMVKNGRKTKLPFQVNGHPASSADPKTWNSFIQCVSIVSEFDGVGFVFSKDTSDIMGVDFDHVYENGVWNQEVLEEIKSLGSYAELSPSGAGAHVIIHGKINGDRNRIGNHEIYNDKRFFTVTGNHIQDTPLTVNNSQEALDNLYNKLFSESSKTNKINTTKSEVSVSDAKILEVAQKAKNAEKFKALYEGNWKALYSSQSEADLAFCSMLAFYTQDTEQIDNIYRSSRLNREKWNRQDYRDGVINKAVNGLTSKFDWNKNNNEVIIEIPEYDFKFTINYDDYFKIKIPNYSLPKQMTFKKFFDVTNNSRDQDLIKFLTLYGEIELEKSKKIIIEFNKKIGSDEYHKKLENLMFDYDENKEKKSESKSEPEPYEAPEIMQKAEEIISNGNPHEFISNVYQTIHIGDPLVCSSIFLAIMNQSIKNSKGLQISFNGASSDGKSHAVKSMLILIPKKQYIDTSISAKALFYYNIERGTIIYSDDTKIDPDLLTTLKRDMTNFQSKTLHLTVDSTNEGHVASEKYIPERMVYLFTSVQENDGEELQNRKLQITIDDSEYHKHKVLDMQKRVNQNGYDPYLNEPTKDMIICRAIFSIFHKLDYGVAIPFVYRINGYDIHNFRNNDKFYDMIKGFTLSKYKQRDIDENGNLIATEEDFHNAAAIYNKIYKNLATNLTNAEIKMCNAIALFKEKGCTVKELQEVVKISLTAVYERLKIIQTKLPNLFVDEETQTEGFRDDCGNISSTSKRNKKYYLVDFDEKNYNKAFYLMDHEVFFDESIKDLKFYSEEDIIDAGIKEKEEELKPMKKINLNSEDDEEEKNNFDPCLGLANYMDVDPDLLPDKV